MPDSVVVIWRTGIEALGRGDFADGVAVGADQVEAATILAVVWPLRRIEPDETQRVAGQFDRLARHAWYRIFSVPKESVPTMPSNVRPRPRWASAVPKTERGRPAKRLSMTAGATRCRSRT